MTFKRILVGFTFCISVSLAALQTANAQSVPLAYKPVVGQTHPDFRLPSIDDQREIALSDYRGKKVLLVHFASW